jgi:hypothetical protein
MPFGVIAHLIAHPGGKDELSAILQLGVQLTLQTQQDMASPTPVISKIAGAVFDHANTDRTKLTGAPISGTGFTGMFDGLD